jgi:hypothetical protein
VLLFPPFAPSSFALFFVHRDLLPKSLPQFKPFKSVSLKCDRGMWTKKMKSTAQRKRKKADQRCNRFLVQRDVTDANSRSDDGASSGRKKSKKKVTRKPWERIVRTGV